MYFAILPDDRVLIFETKEQLENWMNNTDIYLVYSSSPPSDGPGPYIEYSPTYGKVLLIKGEVVQPVIHKRVKTVKVEEKRYEAP